MFLPGLFQRTKENVAPLLVAGHSDQCSGLLGMIADQQSHVKSKRLNRLEQEQCSTVPDLHWSAVPASKTVFHSFFAAAQRE